MAGLYFFCCIFLLQNDVSGGTCFTGTLAHGALSFGIKTLKCLQKGRTAVYVRTFGNQTKVKGNLCRSVVSHSNRDCENRQVIDGSHIPTATLLPDCHQVTVTVRSLFFFSLPGT